MQRTLFWIVVVGLFSWAAVVYPDFRWLYLLGGVLALSRLRRGRFVEPPGGSP